MDSAHWARDPAVSVATPLTCPERRRLEREPSESVFRVTPQIRLQASAPQALEPQVTGRPVGRRGHRFGHGRHDRRITAQ